MYKIIFFMLVLCNSLNVKAQKYSKRDFSKTDWFSENTDSSFFNKDTIQLIKLTNPAPTWDKGDFAECELCHLKHGNYINFIFKRNGKFKYWVTYDNYINTATSVFFKWHFYKKNQILVINIDNLSIKFKPISEKQIEIKSKYYSENKEPLKTIELTLIRLK